MSDLAESQQKIQLEATIARAPVAESLAQDMGGAINYMFNHIFAVGDLCPSMSTEAQFQASHGTNWILSDGRAVPGSIYASTRGATVPDMRGVYPRGKDNGRGLDPAGDLALGTYEGDTLKDHSHPITNSDTGGHGGVTLGSQATGAYSGNNTGGVNSGLGGAETRVKSVVVNWFIRIN